MIKLQNTKTLKQAYKAYKQSNAYSLEDVYNSWSNAKGWAFNHFWVYCRDLNGLDYKIISFNTFGFSVGFTFEKDNKKIFCYITKDSKKFLDLSKVEG